MAIPIVHAMQGHIFARKISDEAYYAQAAHEIKNNVLSEGLWAKAWSDAHGDNVKAQALYIKYRVEDLQQQAARKFAEYAKAHNGEPAKVVINCPQCDAKLRVAAGKYLEVNCPKCATSFRTTTSPPPLNTSYGGHFARYIYALAACAVIVLIFSIIIAAAKGSGALILGGIVALMAWACSVAWKAIVK